MQKALFKKLNTKKNRWVNEEEVRQGWIIELSSVLGINFHAERGRKDSSYNNVIIEFKDKGLFKGKISSPAFKEAIYERLLPYILKTSRVEGINESDYIGIAIDADHVCFAQVKNGSIEHGDLMPLSEASVLMILTALTGSYRRAITAENLIEDFGHTSELGHNMMSVLAEVLCKHLEGKKNTKVRMLYEEWRSLFGQVADLTTEQVFNINKTLGFNVKAKSIDKISTSLFVIHTYNSIIIKLLAAEIISAHKLTSYNYFSQKLSNECDDVLMEEVSKDIEKGQFYKTAGIDGFVEEALFSWYIDATDNVKLRKETVSALRSILIKLSFYRTDNLDQARSNDLLKLFYQNLVPETLRKSLGEFYTPDWLVSFTLNQIGRVDWINNRTLDPTCGSGSFLLEVIKRKVEAAKKVKMSSSKILENLVSSVWGFDLNPLAVQTARVNYLIAIADLLNQNPGKRIEIPVLLADAIYSPARDPNSSEDVVTYTIGSQLADLEIVLPAELSFDRVKLDYIFEIMGNAIEDDLEYETVHKMLLKSKYFNKAELNRWYDYLKITYDRVLNLHKKKWNGIWFRIIRNFFWSATAGKFNLIAGNPPWVRWSKLPELYRQRVKPTCMSYDIFSKTPHHGGNELDISGMITYTVADKWLLEGGTLAFIITQTHFQSPSSQGFRNFKIRDNLYINPISVDDMKDLRPFPDAMNKTAVAIFKKQVGVLPKYPVKYRTWSARLNKPKVISVSSNLKEVNQQIEVKKLEANPVTSITSPWAILPKGRFSKMKKLIGKCDWVQGRKGITADLNGIYFVNIEDVNDQSGLVKIKTRPDAGKRDIGPSRQFWIEPDILYPLIKGASDFTKSYFNRDHSLYVLVPNSGIILSKYNESLININSLQHTSNYFRQYQSLLKSRSTFKGRMFNAPYFAIYNVGDYTFSPYKVIWAEQKDFCAAVVSESNTPLIGNRPFVPDHKVFFADFENEDIAYYLCGLLNSNIVIEFIKSHNISTQIGDIFKHLKLPIYNSSNRSHLEVIDLSKKAHFEPDISKRNQLLNDLNSVSEIVLDE